MSSTGILITSLYKYRKSEPIRYYCVKDGYRELAVNAMLTIEAASKYILSQYPIDEIIAIGNDSTCEHGEENVSIELRKGSDFYDSNLDEMPSYSIFRYRMAQFIDELKIDQMDIQDSLEEGLQKELVAVIKEFYKEVNQDNPNAKFNRFFWQFSKDDALWEQLKERIQTTLPETKDNWKNVTMWVRNYLYQGLKDTGKLELLPGNEDVRVCFVPSDLRDNENRPVENVHLLMKDILATEGTVDLYVALNNDNVTDTFVLMNIVDIIKSMPGDRIRLKKVITTTNDRDAFVNIIKDDTSDFAITNLVSAIQAFLKYGKVDLFLDYWKNTGLENPLVDSVIYAMRRIDTGISLCNVQEIEDGIVQLRQLMNEDFNGKNDYNTRLFELIAEEIRQDYGPLLEGDKVEFIELVKWSYRKKFYQQTLTFIEAKAPKGIVSKGWFYYLNDEEDKEHVTDLFAKIRSKMRPFEYYKINDLDHYFVKLYHRDMVNSAGKPKAAQRRFAQYRISDLDNTDEENITAYTQLQDREILENLLFSYYWASIVRNNTNHADAKEGEDDRLIVDKSDVGLRLAMIEEAVQYFLDCWEKAEEQNVSDPDVLRIDPFEVKRKSQKMKKDR